MVNRSSVAGPLVIAQWRRLDPPRRSRLLIGPQQAAPLSFGVLKPTVLAPASLAESGGAAWDAVLRHEIAHLRHRDPLSRALFNAAMPVLGLHPLYWILRGQAMFAAELRADAGAAAICGAEHYVDSLVRLFNQGGRSRRLLAASTVWASESEFCRRMTMLLRSSRPIRQRTSLTWSTVASLFALAGVVVFADQCGVVYAQTAKTSSAQATEDALASSLQIANETAKTVDPFAVKTTAVKTSAAKTTAKAATAKTGRFPDAPFDATTVAQVVDPTTARAGYGSPFGGMPQRSAEAPTAWDAINIQIADRRAKLAGAQALPEREPHEALRLELEVMALESSKRQLDMERRAQATEKQIQDLTRDNETLRVSAGPDHPGLAQLGERMKRLEEQMLVIRRQMEVEQETADARIRARVAQEMRPGDPGAKTAVKTAHTVSTAKTANPAFGGFGDAQAKFAEAQAQIANLRDENARLRSELQSLQNQRQIEAQKQQLPRTSNPSFRSDVSIPQRSANNPLTETRRELPSIQAPQQPRDLGQSLPYVKHQLRVAESELPLYQARLDHYIHTVDRVDKLQKQGVISTEEIDNARGALEVAKAELRKAQINIDSLQKLIKDLESDASAKPKTSVAR